MKVKVRHDLTSYQRSNRLWCRLSASLAFVGFILAMWWIWHMRFYRAIATHNTILMHTIMEGIGYFVIFAGFGLVFQYLLKTYGETAKAADIRFERHLNKQLWMLKAYWWLLKASIPTHLISVVASLQKNSTGDFFFGPWARGVGAVIGAVMAASVFCLWFQLMTRSAPAQVSYMRIACETPPDEVQPTLI